jgi:acyl carrier protein
MTQSGLARLKNLIAHEMPEYVGKRTLADETPMFRGGLELDSVGVIQLLSLAEAHFGVRFEEHDLIEENFQTPLALSRLLLKHGVVQADP